MTKKLFIVFSFVFLQHAVLAQDESFESTSTPSNWTASNGSLAMSINTDHYKHGSKSLQWDWVANANLEIVEPNGGVLIADPANFFENMFRFWVYNTAKISDENSFIKYEFLNSSGQVKYSYNFKLNFKGWRAASASFKNEMPVNTSSIDIYKIRITAPNSGSGIFFFDYITYRAERILSRSADRQLDFLPLDNNNHWIDQLYFENLPKDFAATTPNSQESEDLVKIKSKYDLLILGKKPSNDQVTSAVNDYNLLNIQYNSLSEVVNGVPFYGSDDATSEQIGDIDKFILTLARSYKHNENNTTHLTYFLNTVRHMLDQGYANGSGMESMHHQGYSFRNVASAIHLMKTELKAESEDLWDEARLMVEWNTAVDIIWHPSAHNSNMDDALTRSNSILGACIYKDTDAEKVQYLKGFKQYIERWLTTYSEEGEGLKVDYTAFHHNVHYPGYAHGALTGISLPILYMSGTLFEINSAKTSVLKNALLVARVLGAGDNIPNSLSGRNPFVTPVIRYGLYNLGLALNDGKLKGAYNYLYGADTNTDSEPEETPPTGFWQINFANLGVYRQSDWVADVKGFNKYFWGSEIYTKENRYGRYQSYGAIEIMYKGGHNYSGFNINGWDWNMPPGTTTIHLPDNILIAEEDRLDEKTDSNFAAALRFGSKSDYYIKSEFEGAYGMFAMDFQQKNLGGNHNSTFKFKKSTFFFDGKIICLGSNIQNNDSNNITATNLFQNRLAAMSDPIIVNNNFQTGFPYGNTLTTTSDNWLIDVVNTGYFVKSGNDNIVIGKQNQTSPSETGTGTTTGNFATAYLNHGSLTLPSNKGYEYVIVPKTTVPDMQAFTSNMSSAGTAFYEVIQKDDTAHILKHDDYYGFALFKAGNYGVSSPIKSNDKPALVMLKDDLGTLNVSIVSPDLNFTSIDGSSKLVTIEIVVDGQYDLITSSDNNITVTKNVIADETIISVSVKDGLPVDTILEDATLAVEDEMLDEKIIMVYPNPASNQITIYSSTSNLEIKNAQLFDVSGKMIISQKSSVNTMDVSVLSKGVYFLAIDLSNGHRIHKKLIKN